MKKLFNSFLFTFILLGLITVNAYSQVSDDIDSVENMIIYSNEHFGQVIAHNLGMGVGYRIGKNTSAFNTRIFTAEIVTMRSWKQIKTINPYYSNSKRYVYGKMNEVFNLRAGIGFRKLLNDKPYWGGVELRWITDAGASIAFEKPYYIYVIKIEQGAGGNYLYNIETELFDPNTSWDDIYGRAPFTKGLNEIKLVPGIYLRSGFSFEFGEIKTRIKAFEAGGMVEFFPGGVSIMADNGEQPFFITFYLAYSFGHRLNKY